WWPEEGGPHSDRQRWWVDDLGAGDGQELHGDGGHGHDEPEQHHDHGRGGRGGRGGERDEHGWGDGGHDHGQWRDLDRRGPGGRGGDVELGWGADHGGDQRG